MNQAVIFHAQVMSCAPTGEGDTASAQAMLRGVRNSSMLLHQLSPSPACIRGRDVGQRVLMGQEPGTFAGRGPVLRICTPLAYGGHRHTSRDAVPGCWGVRRLSPRPGLSTSPAGPACTNRRSHL
jgi:hypothetical protein